jgi:hypothetical protein
MKAHSLLLPHPGPARFKAATVHVNSTEHRGGRTGVRGPAGVEGANAPGWRTPIASHRSNRTRLTRGSQRIRRRSRFDREETERRLQHDD